MSAHDCLSEYRQIAKTLFGNPRFASSKSPLYWPQPKYDHHPFESQFESLLRRYDRNLSDVKPREILLGSDIKNCKTYVALRIPNYVADLVSMIFQNCCFLVTELTEWLWKPRYISVI